MRRKRRNSVEGLCCWAGFCGLGEVLGFEVADSNSTQVELSLRDLCGLGSLQ